MTDGSKGSGPQHRGPPPHCSGDERDEDKSQGREPKIGDPIRRRGLRNINVHTSIIPLLSLFPIFTNTSSLAARALAVPPRPLLFPLAFDRRRYNILGNVMLMDWIICVMPIDCVICYKTIRLPTGLFLSIGQLNGFFGLYTQFTYLLEFVCKGTTRRRNRHRR